MNFINRFTIVAFLFYLGLLFIYRINAEDWDKDQVNRLKWFYGQRSYPNQNIPPGAYSNAIKQYLNNSNMNGYYSPDISWICIGPKPGAMGQAISGRIATIKFNPGDVTGMTIFAGGSEGGIWKTTDGGITWTAKTDFITSLSSGALAIGQNSSGQFVNIYYGTGESHFGHNFCYYGDGLYKSTDNGETWYQINDANLPDRPTYFSRIVVRPGHPNELLAACGTNHTNISFQSGLYRSTDYGETWLSRLVPEPSLEGRVCNDVVFSPNGKTAYITGADESGEQIYEKGVHYRISYDGGATFSSPRDDIIRLQGRSHIAVSNSNPNRVYILSHVIQQCPTGSCSPTASNAVLYMSTDAGQSFSSRYTFLAYNCNCGGGDAYQSWYDMFIYVSPQNQDLIYIGLINLWKSTDGGQSFLSVTPPHTDMQNMDFDVHHDNHIVIGGDGGIYRSTNAGSNNSWLNLNDQLSLTLIYRIASSPFNPEVIVGGSQDNGIQSKFEFTDDWRDVLGGNDGTSVLYSQLDPNIAFGGFGNYTTVGPPPIVRSTNAGRTFSGNFQPQYGIWDSQNDWIPPLASSVHQGLPATEYFYTARRCYVNPPSEDIMIRFFYSSDNGNNWNKLGNGIHANESPQNIEVSKSNPQIMFLSTGSYAWPQTNQKLYKSINAGMDWFEILNNQSSEVPNRYITHIEIDPSDENIVMLTLSGFNSLTPGVAGHVFRSTNGGVNWQNISGSLPDIPVNDIVSLYDGKKNYIIGTDAGALISSDGGNSWRELGRSLPHSVVSDIEYNPITGLVRAALFGRGVWQFSLQSMSANIDYPFYLNSDADGLKIEKDLVIERGGKLIIPFPCMIKLKEGRKIIIKEGGELIAEADGPVSFTSQSGMWGGIEIFGRASLNNCIFSNTETPIVAIGQIEKNESLEISNCTFNNGNVIFIGRNDISLKGCSFIGCSEISGTALSAVYCNNILISNNIINDVKYSGISVSNSNVLLNGNKITCEKEYKSPAGISFDNCVSSTVSENIIKGFKNDISFFNSRDVEVKINYRQNDKNKYIGNTENINKKTIQIDEPASELRIIELFLLTQNKFLFGHQYQNLIPATLVEGIKMINERLFGKIELETDNSIPEIFSLLQNFPNPFNPTTTIKYSLPKEGYSAIKVFDVLGREVLSLPQGYQKAGWYEVIVNANELSSGVYFYKLSVYDNNKAELYTASKKLVIVK